MKDWTSERLVLSRDKVLHCYCLVNLLTSSFLFISSLLNGVNVYRLTLVLWVICCFLGEVRMLCESWVGLIGLWQEKKGSDSAATENPTRYVLLKYCNIILLLTTWSYHSCKLGGPQPTCTSDPTGCKFRGSPDTPFRTILQMPIANLGVPMAYLGSVIC